MGSSPNDIATGVSLVRTFLASDFFVLICQSDSPTNKGEPWRRVLKGRTSSKEKQNFMRVDNLLGFWRFDTYLSQQWDAIFIKISTPNIIYTPTYCNPKKMNHERSEKKTMDLFAVRNLQQNQIITSWWFQPSWKILVKMGIFPK